MNLDRGRTTTFMQLIAKYRETYLLIVCPGLLNVDCLLQNTDIEFGFIFK